MCLVDFSGGEGNFNVHLTKGRNCEIFFSKTTPELGALDFGWEATPFEILVSFWMDQVEK